MSREQRLARVFVELADTLIDEFDVIDFLYVLCERSVELLPADAAGLILADQRGGLEVMASTTEEARVLELFVLQNSEGPCLDCYLSGQPQVNLNLSEVETRWPNFRAAAADAGYETTHALPMRLRGQVIGALNLFCARQVSLTPDEVALGQALCDVATIGLLQERTVRRGEILAEQLQNALNSRILIEQAKGVLAERTGVGVDEAFTMMRAWARQHGKHLHATAQAVVDGTAELLTPQPG